MASQSGANLGPTPFGSQRKSGSARTALLAALVAFLAGGALVAYLLWDRLPAAITASAPAASASASPRPQSTIGARLPGAAPVGTDAAAQALGIDQRLTAAEQRLTQLDLQAQAAAGNAARAESLLIAFATRRSVERGAELGYLADQLRLRFGDQWPNAVSTIVEFSRSPVRLDELTARLEGLAPQLDDSSEGPSWEAFQREIGELFVFRRETTPSPQPQRRLERARWALEQGRYRAAIDEVKAMPGADKAQKWIDDAERYRKAMEALEVIETAAVLDQRGLRDGAGNPVRQLGALGGPLVRP